jgi:hypothetical protein
MQVCRALLVVVELGATKLQKPPAYFRINDIGAAHVLPRTQSSENVSLVPMIDGPILVEGPTVCCCHCILASIVCSACVSRVDAR